MFVSSLIVPMYDYRSSAKNFCSKSVCLKVLNATVYLIVEKLLCLILRLAGELYTELSEYVRINLG